MEKQQLKYIFVCSPLRGDVKGNMEKARKYARFVVKQGFIPIVPHLYFTQFLDDNAPEERRLGIDMGKQMLKLCHEMWVFGDTITEGMRDEIETYEGNIKTFKSV